MTNHNGSTPRSTRRYDLIVWGATGFTGRLVAEYLATHHPDGPRLAWAIGGRSKGKLEEVRAGLAKLNPALADLPIVVGDARDAKALSAIAGSAKVIASTVGPYAVHGREMVAACVEHGTDYCDLTGETHFVRAMVDAHHARAKATGARIVHCAGFDSIPSDLGVLVLQEAMKAKTGKPCAKITYFLSRMRGGMSGGTIASMCNLVDEASKDKQVRRILGNPYALDPDRGSPGPDGPDQRGVRWDEELGEWTAPFMMAAINTRIVRRSNALLGYAWGKDMRYAEVTSTGAGMKGLLRASALTAGLVGLLGAVAVPPVRKLLQRTVLPAPGEGPTKEQRERGFFEVRLVGVGADGTKMVAKVAARQDPGYGATAVMLSETALALVEPPSERKGGVLTPASSLGMKLVDRLRTAGMTFEV